MLAAVAETPARDAIDWQRLDIWWGDERFMPTGHGERNEAQAREALLDHVTLDPARVHPMPPDEGAFLDDPEAAAEAYAVALKRASRPEDHADVPSFDVLMLGVGPDAHIASMFPGMPALYETERTWSPCGARRSRRRPGSRLTMPAIHAAQEVWVIAAGQSKAAADPDGLGGQRGGAGAGRGRARPLPHPVPAGLSSGQQAAAYLGAGQHPPLSSVKSHDQAQRRIDVRQLAMADAGHELSQPLRADGRGLFDKDLRALLPDADRRTKAPGGG